MRNIIIIIWYITHDKEMNNANSITVRTSFDTVPVNKIIPMSAVDGPGNRTSIFLQGCNIACAYCHNPETQQLCISCGKCVAECPAQALSIKNGKTEWDSARCVSCDHCIAVCEHHASPKIRMMTAKQVAEEAEKNIPFIRGITVSGGECMLHTDFLTELFTLVRSRGLTCLIDSNGTIPFEKNQALLEVTDGVMLDVKSWEPEVFSHLTGADLSETVKQNLRFLAERGKLEEVRIVCLEGEVDVPQTIAGIAAEIPQHLEDFTLKLIRFRPYGVKGRLAGRQSPSTEQMKEWEKMAVNAGFRKIRIT